MRIDISIPEYIELEKLIDGEGVKSRNGHGESYRKLEGRGRKLLV